MKNKIILMLTNCLLVLFVNKADAQIIQGAGVIPFSQAITTNLISNATRMSYDVARTKINDFDPSSPKYDSTDQMAGEYFLVDNRVVQFVCRNRSANYDFRHFVDTKATFRAMYTNTLGDVYPIGDDYYDEIKNLNGFQALVYYFKSEHIKRFIAQDLTNKYVIIGTIYCSPNDITAAETYANTLLNNITFN